MPSPFRLRSAALLLSLGLTSLAAYSADADDVMARIKKAAIELHWDEADKLAADAIAASTTDTDREEFQDIQKLLRTPEFRVRYEVSAAMRAKDWPRAEQLLQERLTANAGKPGASAELAGMLVHVYARQDPPKAAEALAVLADKNYGLQQNSELQQRLLTVVAFAAQRAKDQASLEQALTLNLDAAKAWPATWTRDGSDLIFQPAGLRIPLTAGPWILSKLEPGSYRNARHIAEYSLAGRPGDSVNISFGWKAEAPSRADRSTRASHEVGIRTGQTGGYSGLDTPLPTLPLQDFENASGAVAEGQEFDGSTTPQAVAVWVGDREGWQIRVAAVVEREGKQAKFESLAPLLSALRTEPAACVLPADAEKRDEHLDAIWQAQDWKAIDQLNDQSLGGSCFALDIARLQGLRSLGAYQHKNWKAASEAATPALEAWNYTAGRNGDGELRRALTLTSADAAYRLGDSALGDARLASYQQREFKETLADMKYPGWKLDEASQSYLHTASGSKLPWHKDSYMLKLLDRDMATYTDFSSGALLGLTFFSGERQPDPEKVELPVNWLKQQALNPGKAVREAVEINGHKGVLWRIPYTRDKNSRYSGVQGKGEMYFWTLSLRDTTLVMRGEVPANHKALDASLRKLAASLP